MAMKELLVVTLLALGSHSSAKPNSGFIINLDVDVHSDNGEHVHKSVEVVDDDIVARDVLSRYRDGDKDGIKGKWRQLKRNTTLGKTLTK